MPAPTPLSRIVSIALALALSGAGVVGIGMARGDDAAPVLIVTGRVIDAQGQPIPKARVVTRDARLSATVDASGRYTLTLPLARADMLARYPYALSLRAEAKGWTIALPSGDSGLGLELRTVAALDGTNRCFARSNDVRVAAAAARAVGSAKEPAAVTVNFVGEKGERAPGADPELTQTAQVALSALALPPLRDSISVTVTERPVVQAPPAQTPAPAPPPSMSPAPATATQPAPTTPPVNATPVPAATPSASSERSDRRAEEKRIAREEKERENEAKEKRAREEALARIAADAAKESAKGSTIERQEREREEELARREAKDQARVAKRQEKEHLEIQRIQRRSAERAEKDERAFARDSTLAATNAARNAARDSTRAAANVAREAKAREEAARVAAARLAKATASKPAPAAEERVAAEDQVAAKSVPETPAAVEKPPVVEAPRPAAAASKPRREVVIHPTPDGEARVRSAPFVIRSGGRSVTEAAPATDSCQCRIEGTIEVRSKEPLASRVKVVVSLAWFPAAADTVELFMGSPRAFKLPAAACGPQRLKVGFPGRERFVVLTRDAVAGFRCEGGPAHQVRIVLGPR